ncbi:DUF3710 domain-containing protein [Fodinibacter luteus]|uniref:DUF3710 domain-containing protein n=1 Tax=Fodinibacter luteus TaxID=552064 RepID=A0ABP8KFT4_9MICO
MSIFKRSKDSGRASRAERDAESQHADGRLADGEVEGTGAPADGSPAGDDAAGGVDRSDGPWDVTEVDGRDGRVDLGALWVRGVQGMELRLEVDQASQQVNAATAVLGDSALQMQAFAAPRSGGLWEEIRREIADAVGSQGGTAEEHEGTLGTELRTRMPSAGPDGRTVFAPATFLGVDGPRWFLRGVLSGRAAIDEAAAAPLLAVLRAAVVVRGTEPMAPRELLPLALPREAERAAQAAEADADAADEAERRSLDPFERGPEITEVR